MSERRVKRNCAALATQALWQSTNKKRKNETLVMDDMAPLIPLRMLHYKDDQTGELLLAEEINLDETEAAIHYQNIDNTAFKSSNDVSKELNSCHTTSGAQHDPMDIDSTDVFNGYSGIIDECEILNGSPIVIESLVPGEQNFYSEGKRDSPHAVPNPEIFPHLPGQFNSCPVAGEVFQSEEMHDHAQTVCNDKKKKDKKRQSNEERRKEKHQKDLGKTYVNRKRVIIKGKECLVANCSDGCLNKIGEDERKVIFDDFWKTGDKNVQDSFISSCIVTKVVGRRRSLSSDGCARRNSTNEYFLVAGHLRHKVCKSFFMKTLNIGESRIRHIKRKNSESTSGVICMDMRGKHGNSRKIASTLKDGIRMHIKMFPLYQSHYARERTDKLFLSPELNVRKMYELYVKQMNSVGEPSAKPWLYYSIFKKEFHYLSFASYKVDTCNTCDMYKVNPIRGLNAEYDAHKQEAEAMYQNKRIDRDFAASSSDTAMICYDLQKCLPSPYLTCSQVFYKRVLWVYNLTIYEYNRKQGYCFMWPEHFARRGSNEIMSCLKKYIEILQSERPNIKKLILYSDSCPGQNKNSIILGGLKVIMESTCLESIQHNYLVPGHTHMECDHIHSLIDRCKKKSRIFVPTDWYNVVRLAKTKEPLLYVVEMTKCMFYDFKTTPTVSVAKNSNFSISKIRCFQLHKGEDRVLFKYSALQAEYQSASLTSKAKNSATTLEILYHDGVKIPTPKYNDLISLLKFIPDLYHDYYAQLKHHGNVDYFD
jgi:hypothetical protein